MNSEIARSVTVHAPAKVNLMLDVLGKRDDGYHDIHSLVTPVSLYDTLTLEPTDGVVTVSMQPAGLPSGTDLAAVDPEHNLAVRAARLFLRRNGLAAGCRIAIRKRIPVGGGLGGGSADAAGVLLGLNRLFGMSLGRDRLAAWGSELGSDVSALLWNGPVWMSGRGETVTPLPPPVAGRYKPFWMVLLNPGFAVLTADIYRRWNRDLTFTPQDYTKVASVLREADVNGLTGHLRNSLQTVAFKKYPALELLACALREAGARGVLLAGSGATVFGVSATRAEAVRVRRAAVEGMDQVIWSRVVKTMPDGVMVAHGPLEARV